MRYLKLLLGIALFFLLFLIVDFRQVIISLSNLTLEWILVLILITWALLSVSVLKWQLFLARLGNEKPFRYLFKLYLVGYFINLVMPSYIGGDVVRGYYAGGKASKNESLSATFLERYTGLGMMIIMALLAVHFAPSATLRMQLVIWAAAFCFFAGTYCLYSGWFSRLLSFLPLTDRMKTIFTKFQAALRFGMSERKLLLQVLFLSLFFHLLTIVNTWAVSEALGWSGSSFLDLATVVPLILIIGAIPVSPQGLGIQEGAFFFFLRAVGYPDGIALAVPLVLRAKSYFLAILGGFVWLGLPPSGSPKEADE